MPKTQKRKKNSSSNSHGEHKKDKKKWEEYKPTPKEIIEGKAVIEHNTKCFAEWRSSANNDVYPCVVLDSRLSESAGNISVEQRGERFQYYVNYTAMDRRNDCWLARNKICFFEELCEEDQKFATNVLNSVDLAATIKEQPVSVSILLPPLPNDEILRDPSENSELREVSPYPSSTPLADNDFITIKDSFDDSFSNSHFSDHEKSDDEKSDSDEDEIDTEKLEGEDKPKLKHGLRKLGDLTQLPAFDAHHDSGDEHDLAARIKNVDLIRLGIFEIEPWYFSPVPNEYLQGKCLHFCEFCLSLFSFETELRRHLRKCNVRHPPGIEIYRSQERSGHLTMFEIDGRVEPTYCQNLCYLAKFFLDHKFVRYDTHDFLFYVLTEWDDKGYHMVAYFSKEKACRDVYLNLACILTLPCHQQKGYAYELSKIEKKIGQPEGPISDLGRRSYESYWRNTVYNILKTRTGKISVDELSKLTSIRTQDIRATLEEGCHLIRYHNGEWLIDMSKTTEKRLFPNKLSNAIYCDPTKLHWVPFILQNKREKVYK